MLATPATVLASCAEGPSLGDMARDPSVLEADDTFFIGTAVRILPAVESDLGEFNDRSLFTPAVIRVQAVIRGPVATQAVVMDPGGTLPDGTGTGSSGTIGFRTGRRYVVVGKQNVDGTYLADACAASGLISKTEAQKLVRLAGGRAATRPSPLPPDGSAGDSGANGSGSNTLTILLAFLAGAGLSTALVLARRRRQDQSGAPSTDSVGS
jgi:hypothetical protein